MTIWIPFICFICPLSNAAEKSECISHEYIFIDLLPLSLSLSLSLCLSLSLSLSHTHTHSHTHTVTLALDYAITLNRLPVLLKHRGTNRQRVSTSLNTDVSVLPSNLICRTREDAYRGKGKLYTSVFMFRGLRMDLSLPTLTPPWSACAPNALITSPEPCPASISSLHFSQRLFWSLRLVWVWSPIIYLLPCFRLVMNLIIDVTQTWAVSPCSFSKGLASVWMDPQDHEL